MKRLMLDESQSGSLAPSTVEDNSLGPTLTISLPQHRVVLLR